jgi:hypothetical protein
MVKLGMGASIIISVILGIILLYLFGISAFLSVILLGFIATFLTTPNERNYLAGGLAGIVLAILIFIFGLFIWPVLPVDLPSLPASTMVTLQLSGLFNLILGLIFTIIICFIFGSLGGLIAQKMLDNKKDKPRAHTRNNINKNSKRKPQRTLNKNFKN